MKILLNIALIVVCGFVVSACGDDDNVIPNAKGADVSSIPAAQRLNDELRAVGVERFTASDYKPGVVRHIVLFRYQDTVTAAQRQEITQRFLSLQKSQRNGARYIVSIDEGLQSSGEKADQGLQQGFLVTFRSEGDRNFYVGQPIVTDPNFYDANHQAFKDFVGPLLARQGVLVFDYTVDQTASGA
ncbi:MULTISPECIES: Dabb family protein [Burkholderia]|uniref:Dabb family protein n=1 Tax=Burkholderia TaxID=32008 RepID=UPI000B2FF741|nr:MULTISPECIES: Dabb family protein [unclassified Burkholderia]